MFHDNSIIKFSKDFSFIFIFLSHVKENLKYNKISLVGLQLVLVYHLEMYRYDLFILEGEIKFSREK